ALSGSVAPAAFHARRPTSILPGRTGGLSPKGIPMRSLWFAVAGLLTVAGVAGAEGPRRPNVLWICADDHAPYVCGAYGNKVVRTPTLDRLASGGMRLDRAYCNSPVCTASRQSFLTGRYPRTLGVTQLQTPLPDGEQTLARLLRAAGYDTAAIGKMHFNSDLT